MDRINLTDNGGFPLEQDTLGFMQMSYSNPLSAVAKLCGDKTILDGLIITAGNVSAGWISLNGELIPFQACPFLEKVIVIEVPTAVTFEDGILREEYYTRVARCSIIGDFDFAELVPLRSLKNIWLPGDLREKLCDSNYIEANFDNASGLGKNLETGWQILSKAYPETAGKTFVNIDFADTDFDQVGKMGGLKEVRLTPSEQGRLKFRGRSDDGDTSVGNYRSLTILQIGDETIDVGNVGANTYTDYKYAKLDNAESAHDNMQPYFVILKLVKL